MPSLHTDSSTNDTYYDYWSADLVKLRHCSILAHIEIASCFRNIVEPLFRQDFQLDDEEQAL